MKYLRMQFVLAVLLPAFSLTYAAGVCSAQSINIQSIPDQVTGFDASGERVDLTAIRTGEDQGPVDLDGIDVRIDSRQSSPDDVFWDNSISPSFPGADGTVSAMTEFRGNLIVAGNFTFIDNTPIKGIASWDGSSWAPLGADDGPSSIHCLTVFNDLLIAGGGQGVFAWDGDSWTSLGFNTYNMATVYALTVYDGKLIAGGNYYYANGLVGMIRAWNGTSWSTLGTATSPGNAWSAVATLTVFDNELVVGGRFSNIVNSGPAHNIAVWDGLSWSGLGSGTNGDVDALIIYDGKLAAAGNFDSCGEVAANSVAYWDGTSWSGLGSGIQSKSYGPVMTLGVFNGQLVAGGRFRKAGGAVADFLTAWDGDSWSILQAEPNWEVWAMANYDDRLIIGGMFTTIGEARPARIASWNGNTWSTLISAEGGFNGATRALKVYGHKLYAGGEFTTAGGAATDYIACWNGSSWSPVHNGLDSSVAGMMVDDGKLVVGGYFTKAGDVTARHVATWDGGNWVPLGSGTPHPVVAMTRYNNALTVADQYVDYDWIPDPFVRESIRSWDGSAWSLITEKTGSGMEVRDLIAFDDKLLMSLNYFGGFPIPRAYAAIVSWDGISWSYIYSRGGRVGGWTVMDGKLLVGKYISEVWWGGAFLDTLVDSWDGTTWSDMEWDIGGLVRAFAYFDRKLIVGGSFASVGGISANNIAAWDGETWSALGSGTNGPVDRLESYNGTLIVAGDFTMAGGKISPFMSVWTKCDTLEVALDVKPGSCPNPINGNSAHGQGKAVLPVAIMGTADFDVHDIDPTTLTLNGTSPVRWNYEDVGAPPDDPDDECACSEAGPDGYTDLNLKFYSAEIVASLDGGNVVRAAGQLYDGTSFEGQDCVTLVGNPAMRATASDVQEKGFKIFGNYPNPFNPITEISFYLPDAADVKLEIFNILGQHVSTLIDQSLEAGDHSVIWDGSRAASGIYYYRLQSGDKILTDKMLLLK